jgi:hypothetical protein
MGDHSVPSGYREQRWRIELMSGEAIETELSREFDRQVENLVQRDYPRVAGLREDEFRSRLEPLRERIGELAAIEGETEAGRIPFVLVVKSELVAGEQAMPLVDLKGNSGFTTMGADDIKRFKPIDGVGIPDGMAYLLVDVDTGKGTLNITPDEALKTIGGAHRSPLTIDEGISLITHQPEILKTHNCFSMPGSRCGDRRVTALWISGGRPRLGWCWAGNPHTWLGSASCRSRIGPYVGVQ